MLQVLLLAAALTGADYDTAYHEAAERRLDLVIYFRGPENWDVMDRPVIQRELDRFVYLEVPLDYKHGGGWLIAHPAFAQMRYQPGLCVIELSEPQSPHYGRPISAHPFRGSRYTWAPRHYGENEVLTVLRSPSGSLTQRAMFFAVWMHPESPLSVRTGYAHPGLLEMSRSHSQHQADICTQGHHGWDYRFHQAMALTGCNSAREVCAESWPWDDTVLEAAYSCVDAWRHSSGHWRGVAGACRFWGYDVKQGRNGIWYGTGIFCE